MRPIANIFAVGLLVMFSTITASGQDCTPVQAGLVSWWPGEGNASDIIGANSGVSVGGVSFAPGEVGRAFSLDGSTGYIFVPASSSLNVGSSTGFTIEGWI